MGPTQPMLWLETNSTPPPAARASASSRVPASPSYTMAPMTAPLRGPHICSQLRGGPAWPMVFFFMPGITWWARTTPVSSGSALFSRLSAS